MSGIRKALSNMQIAGQKTSGRLHMDFYMGHMHEAKSIAQMLQSSNCIIHALDFSYLEVSASALIYLAESMTRNTSVEMLTVNWHILSRGARACEAGPALCQMLEMNRTLQTLWLSGFKGIGGYVASGLIHNSTLTSLSLECCEVTDRVICSNVGIQYFTEVP